MKKNILIVLLLSANICFAQNKKEQIEQLTFQVDSLKNELQVVLNDLLVKTKSESTLKDDVMKLNSEKLGLIEDIKLLKNAYTDSLSQLNSQLVESLSEKKRLQLCSSLLNFDTIFKIYSSNQLLDISKCTKSIILKSLIYQRLYETVFAKEIQINNSATSFQNPLVVNVVHHFRDLSTAPQISITEIEEYIKRIDLFLNTIDNHNANDSLIKYLSYNYHEGNNLEDFPELTIKSLSEKYILVFYNYAGTGEGDNFVLFENRNNQIKEVKLDVHVEKLTKLMSKYYGKESYVSNSFDINNLNGIYEVVFPIHKENDAACCPSAFVKITSRDLIDFDFSNIQHGIKDDKTDQPWKVVTWKKY